MKENERLAEMDIMEAVRPPNGNGLATGPFTPRWGLLGVLGWKHVESGVEVWVCDGRILAGTSITRDISHIIGHKQFIRRVLLNPEALQVQARGKTADLLDLQLDVSITYRVMDPLYAAATAEPLTELREAARGVIMQLMPAHTLVEFIQDSTGLIRQELATALMQSAVFANHYEVKEVLSVAPTGDTRFTDMDVSIRTAAAEADLIEQRGRNDRIAAEHAHAIREAEMELEDQFKGRDHARALESERLKEQGAIARSVVEAIGQLGASGAHRLEDIAKFVTSAQTLIGGSAAPQLPASSSAPAPQLVARTADFETEALASIAEPWQILDYHVFAEAGRITGASVKLRRREITFTVDTQYPQSPPVATVTGRDGSVINPTFPWIRERSTFADAVSAILAKLAVERAEG